LNDPGRSDRKILEREHFESDDASTLPHTRWRSVIQKLSTLTVAGKVAARHAAILSPEALGFLEELHRLFEPRRRELLARRAARQAEIEAGRLPDFLPETAHVRGGD